MWLEWGKSGSGAHHSHGAGRDSSSRGQNRGQMERAGKRGELPLSPKGKRGDIKTGVGEIFFYLFQGLKKGLQLQSGFPVWGWGGGE